MEASWEHAREFFGAHVNQCDFKTVHWDRDAADSSD